MPTPTTPIQMAQHVQSHTLGTGSKLMGGNCVMKRTIFAFALVFVVCTQCNYGQEDDWCYRPVDDDDDVSYASPSAADSSSGGGGGIGFAAGGAMDINNFRQNVEHDFLPLVTDISYEGLYYDYYFDTDREGVCDELFCPSYIQMSSTDPLSGEEERYLSVGLNSGLTEDDFTRKTLNIVVVLDISGSMGSAFDAYYYDDGEGGSDKTKMEIANESVVAMLDHLAPEDSFGMVLFESEAFLAKPLREVGRTDMDAIRGHILDIRDTGGTNMESGYEMGLSLFDRLGDLDPDQYENRIIFLTDAMPNIGATHDADLLDMVEGAAERNIYTSFIGIGLDFNTTLIHAISQVRGANYYSVHNEDEFATRMDEDFDFMVTPLVFDLRLALESEGFSIDEVFGSPEADEATGTLLYVNTLFPSRVEADETRGGMLLVRLDELSGDAGVDMVASYRNRQGVESSNRASFTFDAALDEAPGTGIRKGILLTRYASLMRDWISDERETLGLENPRTADDLSGWERESAPLTISEEYQAQIADFLEYFRAEAEAIGDDSLDREIEIMEKLLTL